MHAASLRSFCPLDCPDRCSLDVTVEEGRIVSIDAGEENPVTRGFICSKVRKFTRRIYGPDRLLYPLRRTGSKGAAEFERISWDAAVGEIAERLARVVAEHGGESILPYNYGGSNGYMTEGWMDRRLFRRIGSSRLARTLCAAPTGLAAQSLYGKMACVDIADFAHSQVIVIWGANPGASNIHLVPYLKEAKARGAKIVLVDPRRVLPDGLIDLHLAVYPGTDVALALAVIALLERMGAVDRRFLEEWTTGAESLLAEARPYTPERAESITRVPAAQIRAFAEIYAAGSPAVVRCGWGLERNRNGEAAAAAVIALPAVAGKFGVRGGGYLLSTSGAYRFSYEKHVGVAEQTTRVINMNHLGRVLTEPLDPPVKALIVYNCNPAVTVPDQNRVLRGLASEDHFSVVIEQVMTDTARYADIVLPATTFFEHTELSRPYGTYGLMLSEAVIAPEGEAKPNGEIFALIARAMGLREPMFEESEDSLVAASIRAIGGPLPAGTSLEILRRDGRVPLEFPDGSPIQFVTVFPGTPDRKANLWPEALGPHPYEFLAERPSRAFPLALISPATSKTISSTLGEYNFEIARLEMHPEDARTRRIGEGDWIRVWNDLGSVEVRLTLDSRLSPGVVSLPKGFWRKASRNGAVATALVPDTVTRSSGGACFNDARVEVERLQGT